MTTSRRGRSEPSRRAVPGSRPPGATTTPGTRPSPPTPATPPPRPTRATTRVTPLTRRTPATTAATPRPLAEPPDALDLTLSPVAAETFFAQHWQQGRLVVPREEPRRFDAILSTGEVERLVCETGIRTPAFRLGRGGAAAPAGADNRG